MMKKRIKKSYLYLNDKNIGKITDFNIEIDNGFHSFTGINWKAKKQKYTIQIHYYKIDCLKIKIVRFLKKIIKWLG